MKSTMHFSSVLGREGKFDPCWPQNISIFSAQKEAKAPRQLDLETGAKRTKRRAQCSVDLGGYNPRVDTGKERRRDVQLGLRREGGADDSGSESGDSLDEQLAAFDDPEQAARKAAEAERAKNSPETQKAVRRQRRLDRAMGRDTAAGAMNAFAKCQVSQVRASPSVGFTKAKRFGDTALDKAAAASTPEPRKASQKHAVGLPVISSPPDPGQGSSSPSAAKRKPPAPSPWSRMADRDGLSPAQRQTLEARRSRAEERQLQLARTPVSTRSHPTAEGVVSMDGTAQRLSFDVGLPSLPTDAALDVAAASVAGASVGGSPSGREKPRMTTRDVAKALERHEAGMRGANGQPASSVVRGPLFRLDTGRDGPVMGVDQSGVDATAALHPGQDDATTAAGPLLNPEAAWLAAKARHLPRTSLSVAAREHPNALARNAMLQRALDVVDPGNIAKRLRREAGQFEADAERIRELREAKTKERALARAKGEVLPSAAELAEADRRSKRQELEMRATAQFFHTLDPRADDVRTANASQQYPLGKGTRQQRDFFLCSDRDMHENTTAVAALPHLEALAPADPIGAVAPVGGGNKRGAAAKSKKNQAACGPADEDADDEAQSGATPSRSLPMLAQFLGITPAKIQAVAVDGRPIATGNSAVPGSPSGGSLTLQSSLATASPAAVTASVSLPSPQAASPTSRPTGSSLAATQSLPRRHLAPSAAPATGAAPTDPAKMRARLARKAGLPPTSMIFSPKRAAVTEAVPVARPLPAGI